MLEVLVQALACGRDDLFFLLFTWFWAENWASAEMMTIFLLFTWFWADNWAFADAMTFKEPVVLLRSENVVAVT